MIKDSFRYEQLVLQEGMFLDLMGTDLFWNPIFKDKKFSSGSVMLFRGQMLFQTVEDIDLECMQDHDYVEVLKGSIVDKTDITSKSFESGGTAAVLFKGCKLPTEKELEYYFSHKVT